MILSVWIAVLAFAPFEPLFIEPLQLGAPEAIEESEAMREVKALGLPGLIFEAVAIGKKAEGVGSSTALKLQARHSAPSSPQDTREGNMDFLFAFDWSRTWWNHRPRFGEYACESDLTLRHTTMVRSPSRELRRTIHGMTYG